MAKNSIKKYLEAYITKGAEEATAEYTAELRQHAERFGWPSEVVSQLKIIWDGKHHTIQFPEDLETKIRDLEHGSEPDWNSKPALTTFVFGRS